ncbi:MAG: plasmid stability protein [Phenylobacterium sp.]|jgi:plasmid stability protein
MANISVRKLDDEVLQQLRIQAAHHGVSMEEEARQILTRGIIVQEGLGDAAVRLFGDLYADDDDLPIPSREIHQPIKF